MKTELKFSTYATKADLKIAASLHTSDFAKTTDLANLKSDLDKLDIDKLQNIPSNLSKLKSKVENFDIGKLIITPVDVSQLRNVIMILIKSLNMMN